MGKGIQPQADLPVAKSDSQAVLSVIERIATDPQADINKLEKMLDLQERILNKQAESDFFAAMNKAQTEMTRISTDARNPQTQSRYASYAALDRALRPIYSKHGMSLSFDTAKAEAPQHIKVICYVSHVNGFTKTYSVEMPSDGKGPKGNAVMTTTHATGAAMSYGMRYLLKMIFNVAVGEDDTDGNMPDPQEPDISDWIAKIDECATLDDLKDAYTLAFNSIEHNGARAKLNRAKDMKKRELSK